MADPNLDRETAIVLPRIGFEISNFYYDQSRATGQTQRISVKDDDNLNQMKYQFNPVPYNFVFDVSVMVKNAEDGAKIVEQVLPFFRPDFTPTVHLIPELNVTRDIPVSLVSTPVSDLYDNGWERRVMIWSMQFLLKGWIFSPVQEKAIIKMANTVFYFGNTGEGNDPGGLITVTPGLDANGDPTTNSALSVNTSLIAVDDDFGFCVDISGPSLTLV